MRARTSTLAQQKWSPSKLSLGCPRTLARRCVRAKSERVEDAGEVYPPHQHAVAATRASTASDESQPKTNIKDTRLLYTGGLV